MRRFISSFTISLGIMFMLVATFIICVDPFYHFHKPLFGHEAYMDNALYQTPGAAKNLHYNAVIVGSSMTENFRESWFEDMTLDMKKLSYSGAEFRDYKRIYESVFDSPNQVSLVITDINDFQLQSDIDAIYHEYPEYLYNGIGFDDIKYICNTDVFWRCASLFMARLTGNELSADESYVWEEPELFSEERARYDYELFSESLPVSGEICEETATTDNSCKEETSAADESMSLAKEKISILLTVISEHPETTFVFYYPPYSTLYWQEVVDQDKLGITLGIYKESMRMLLECDNVYVFSFFDYDELVTDLDRYRDVCHHDSAGNRYIYECIRDTLIREGNHVDLHRIETKDIDAYFDQLYKMVEALDLSSNDFYR